LSPQRDGSRSQVMFAVQSAFNQVGVAFVVAVFSLGLLTLL
jgi:hypothetical protein